MAELELELRALARDVEFPPTPDVAGWIAPRLESRRARRRLPRRALVVALAVLLLAIAIAFAVPPARTAILDLFGFGGVTIQRVDRLPPAEERDLAAGLGIPVTLEQARHDLGFEILLPPSTHPLQIYEGNYGAAVLLKTPKPALLTQFFGGDAGVLKKFTAGATTVEFLDVDGSPGVWISGGEHVFIAPRAPARLAGNVLLWQRGRVTLRLEGKLTKAEALEIAQTIKRR
jgi:hypothetical protein